MWDFKGEGKTMLVLSASIRDRNGFIGKLSWPNLTFLSPSPSLLSAPSPSLVWFPPHLTMPLTAQVSADVNYLINL